MTPYSAAAAGSRSSRPSSRSAALRTSSGSFSSASRSRSSFTSACSGSPSPSSCWIAFSCWRRKYSRWPFSISDWTCDWIFEPSSSTSASRERIAETRRSRFSTSGSSSSSWRSAVGIVRSVEATRWARALAVVDVRGRELQLGRQVGGEADDLREQALHVARQRLDLLACRRSCRGAPRTRRPGRDRSRPARRGWTRWRPPTRIRSVPSGIFEHLVDDRDRSDRVDVVEAGRLDRGVAGRDEREQPVAGDDVVDQPDRALLADRERHHRLREDDRVLQREDRQRRRQLDLGLEIVRHLEAEIGHGRSTTIV